MIALLNNIVTEPIQALLTLISLVVELVHWLLRLAVFAMVTITLTLLVACTVQLLGSAMQVSLGAGIITALLAVYRSRRWLGRTYFKLNFYNGFIL